MYNTWGQSKAKWVKKLKNTLFLAFFENGAKNGVFEFFHPFLLSFDPKCLYIFGISDFFLIFWRFQN